MKERQEGPSSTESCEAWSGTPMPDCCGPMFERMIEMLSESAGAGAGDPSAEEGAGEPLASCMAAIRRMATGCCAKAANKAAGDE